MSERIKPMARRRGFTLVELVIVVALVGIVMAIAIPSYSNHMTSVRRGDAQAALVAFAAAMERYHVQNGTYVGAADTNTGVPQAAVFPSQAPLEGNTKYYNLTVSAATRNTYELRATPLSNGSQANDGTLRVLSTGERGWQKSGTTTWVAWGK